MKISIVIPSFNQADFVVAALRSVIEQDYPDKEIIFIDGGSTDGTMDKIEPFLGKLSHCISEADEGQSDALRKGFERAAGDVFTWLSTDDLMLPGTLGEAAGALDRGDGCAWALGNVVWIDSEDRILRCWRGEGYTRWASPRLGVLAAGGPSAFFTRELYERVGGVNLALHYQMDTELWWRFSMSGAPYRRLKGYNWALRLHQAAKTSGHMFSDKADPAQQQIAAAQLAEAQHISRLTSAYRFQLPEVLVSSIKVARRLSSLGYLRGQLEDRVWRGRLLTELMEALCPSAP